MLPAAHVPACWATEPSCGQDLAVGAGDVGGVAEHVHVGVAGSAQVGLDVDAPAAALGQARVADDRRRLLAARPDHQVGADLVAVGQHHLRRVHLGHADAEPELDAVLLQRLGGEALRYSLKPLST